MGRALRSSNPFSNTTDDTNGHTDTSYDALSRVVTIQTFDKNGVSTGTVTTSYVGNQATVTDQAGKARRSMTDALGRLTTIVEAPSGLNHSTSYDYDVLGNLVHVTQGSQNLFFMYDSVSRLIRARNPEQKRWGQACDCVILDALSFDHWL